MSSDELLKQKVWEKLKEVYDPEFDVDIVNLGLVYDVKVENGNVLITMTLTSPTCPLGDIIFDEIKSKLESIEGIKKISVDITFDPPWSPDKMSDEAKDKLGWFI